MKTTTKMEIELEDSESEIQQEDIDIVDCAFCVEDGMCCRCGTEIDNFDNDGCDCLCHQIV